MSPGQQPNGPLASSHYGGCCSYGGAHLPATAARASVCTHGPSTGAGGQGAQSVVRNTATTTSVFQQLA